ncbi:Uncharacterised protein [Vibrio cholerae]|nr:Uncharacterised protein [Vibrio cholerae]
MMGEPKVVTIHFAVIQILIKVTCLFTLPVVDREQRLAITVTHG